MNDIEKTIQQVIDKSKDKIRDSLNEMIDELYCDFTPFYEDDLFANMRIKIINSIKSYSEEYASSYDWVGIRAKILAEHRENIIKDLNQDNLKKIEELEKTIEWLQENR